LFRSALCKGVRAWDRRLGIPAMGASKAAKEAGGEKFDWREAPRRPFKRGFLPYAGAEGSVPQQKARRKALGISSVEDPAGEDGTPAPVESYEELGVLKPWLLDGLRGANWLEPSPIEAQGLPIVLAGQNFAGICPAGPQKALAYLVPVAAHIDDQSELTSEDPGPIALVLVPSKEAASSVVAQATKLLVQSSRSVNHTDGIRVVGLYEGGNKKDQRQALGEAGAHIVVATPERVHAMATSNQISLLRVTLLVLDQFDYLLEQWEQIQSIASWIRPERQTLLFAESWPEGASEGSSELCYAGGHPVSVTAQSNAMSGGAGAITADRLKKKVVKKVIKAVAKVPAAAGEEAFPDDWGDPESA